MSKEQYKPIEVETTKGCQPLDLPKIIDEVAEFASETLTKLGEAQAELNKAVEILPKQQRQLNG